MRRSLLIGIALLCHPLLAEAAAEAPATLPPMRFAGDAIGTGLYAPLLLSPRFVKMSRDVIGSPIELRVYHSFQMSRGGRVGGEVSGLLAAGTLGLLPHMYSGEHTITYDVVVNGAVVTSYVYRKSLSRTHNLWSKDNTHGLGKEGVEWVNSTVAQFLNDSASDAKLSDLCAEYAFYFSTPAP